MPSPSQDSEKLTDAELDALRRVADGPTLNGELFGIQARHFRKLLAAYERHRTPSVPGEDMREKARKFVGLHHFGGGVFSDNITLEALREFADEIATLLSSTAALAREEERERIHKVLAGIEIALVRDQDIHDAVAMILEERMHR